MHYLAKYTKYKLCYKKVLLQWSHVAGNFFNECEHTYSGYRNITWISIQNTNYATQKFYYSGQWSHVAGNFFNEDAQTLLWLYQHYFAKFKNYDKNQTMLQKSFITVVGDRM